MAEGAEGAEGSEGAEGGEAAPPPVEQPAVEEEVTGPTGAGWIISLRGYHYHNDKVHLEASKEHYVRQTIIRALKSGKLTIPEEDRVQGGPTEIDLKKIGLAFPVVVPAAGARTYEVWWENKIEGADDGDHVEGGPVQPKLIPAPRFDFLVELCWLDEPPKEEPPPGEEGAPAAEPGDEAAPAAATPPPPAEEAAPAEACAAEGAPAAESPMPPAGELAPDAPPAEAPAEPPAAPEGETPPTGEAPTGEAPAGDNPTPPDAAPAAAPPATAPPATPPAAAPNP